MNVFENMPLNMAHMYERRAKFCLDNSDSNEAIKNYQEASNCIRKAIKQNYSMDCLPMLGLQNDKYICTIMRITNEMLKAGNNKENDVPDDKNHLTIGEKSQGTKQSEVESRKLAYRCDEARTLYVMDNKEPDSLLPFINPLLKEADHSFRKHPKADKDIIEELKIQNSDLRSHVESLLLSQAKLQKENEMLRGKVNDLETELKRLQPLSCDSDKSKKNESFGLGVCNDSSPQSFFHFDDSYYFSNVTD